MLYEEDFFKQYDTWYSSKQGSFALASSMHLTKKILSHWPRRGHKLLAIGFGHWQTIEMLWESGFDTTAIAVSQAQLYSAKQALHNKVEIYMQSFEHLPFDDKSFDYVVLMPPPNPKEYAPLHLLLQETIRLASNGILVQFWNNCSTLGLWRHKDNLPFFLRHRWQGSWRDTHNTLKNLAPKATITTKSTLLGPPSTWFDTSCFKKVNTCVMPLPIGNIVQLRLSFAPQMPFTKIPIRLDPRQIKGVQPVVAMERQNNNFRKSSCLPKKK